MLFPHGQPKEGVVIANQLPGDYTNQAFLLQGATVAWLPWQQNYILLQSVSVGPVSLHIYEVCVTDRQVLRADITENSTALWFVLAGAACVFTEGLGEDVFHQGDCVLAYNPASSCHRICLKKGAYVLACLGLTSQQVQAMSQVNNQLAYFAKHVTAGHLQSLMQLTVKTTEDSHACLRQLMAYNYHKQCNAAWAGELTNSLVQYYVQGVQKEMCRLKMNNGMEAMARQMLAYIEVHYRSRITRKKMALHFEVSEFTIDKAFRSLTNQTVKQYILERCLLAAREYLQLQAASVKCCANYIGMSYNSFLRHYKRRFGCTPSAGRSGHASK